MSEDLTRLTYTCRVCCRSIITTVATPRPHVTHTSCPTCGQRRAVVLGRAYATHGAGVSGLYDIAPGDEIDIRAEGGEGSGR